jgi:hypothetical protein
MEKAVFLFLCNTSSYFLAVSSELCYYEQIGTENFLRKDILSIKSIFEEVQGYEPHKKFLL